MADTVDAPKSAYDNSVRVFDSFYNFDMVVDATKYEIVRSYFKSINNSSTISENFATIIFRIANITGNDPLTLLSFIQGKTKLEANAIMIYYLNSLKSKSSLYGISVLPQPNDNVQRNIVL
jgi:VanZ family protein